MELPVSFFYQRDPVYGAPVSVHPMWRRKADVSARDLDTVVAELNIRVMHLRRLFEGAEVAHTGDLPRLSLEEYGDPEKIAGLIRAHWKIPRGPLRDLTLYVEKAGALVIHSPLGCTSISGVTFAVPGMPPIIALNSEQPAQDLLRSDAVVGDQGRSDRHAGIVRVPLGLNGARKGGNETLADRGSAVFIDVVATGLRIRPRAAPACRSGAPPPGTAPPQFAIRGRRQRARGGH